MLVLSRKPSQQIAIGDSITLTVVAVQGGKVRLGIDAPSDVRVLRSELEQRLTSALSDSLEGRYGETSRDRKGATDCRGITRFCPSHQR